MNYCCKDKKYYSELCQDCINAITTFDSSEYPHYTDYPAEEWMSVVSIKKCECGSEKTGGPGHSHWCPKYEQKDND